MSLFLYINIFDDGLWCVMRWWLWHGMKWLWELHEMRIMMRHEMTMGTTWDDDYDAPWNDYGNYMRWRLWCTMKMIGGTTWDDDYDAPWNDYWNYMRWRLWCDMKWLRELHEMTIMMHHEMTTGTTWDDDYDVAWTDYRNYMRWQLWWAMRWLWELHENMQEWQGTTQNKTFFFKKIQKFVPWSERPDLKEIPSGKQATNKFVGCVGTKKNSHLFSHHCKCRQTAVQFNLSSCTPFGMIRSDRSQFGTRIELINNVWQQVLVWYKQPQTKSFFWTVTSFCWPCIPRRQEGKEGYCILDSL